MIEALRRAAICVVVGLGAGLGLAGCQPETSDRDIALIDTAGVAALLADDEGRALVVDVRRWAEYDAGHIPGAVCVPMSELRSGDPVLAGARPIVVYAESFESPLSAAAAKKLIADGYVDVLDYRGGLAFWREEGREVATPAGGVGEEVAPVRAAADDEMIAPLPGE
ncbi:MAG: rhodanese-like domain-containing protein [Planctomycetota bacterium]